MGKPCRYRRAWFHDNLLDRMRGLASFAVSLALLALARDGAAQVSENRIGDAPAAIGSGIVVDPVESAADAVGITGATDTPSTVEDSALHSEREGRLRVAVNRPNTDVIVDGRSVGVAPVEIDLPAGHHSVRLDSPGQRTWTGSVDVVAGTLTPLRAFLRPSGSSGNAVTATVIAVLAAGVGIGTGVYSSIDRAGLDADRASGRLENTDPRIDRGTAFAAIADGAFGIAAIVGAIGIFLFAYSPGPASIAHVGRRHTLTTDGAAEGAR